MIYQLVALPKWFIRLLALTPATVTLHLLVMMHHLIFSSSFVPCKVVSATIAPDHIIRACPTASDEDKKRFSKTTRSLWSCPKA
jgi:hypothetical protein